MTIFRDITLLFVIFFAILTYLIKVHFPITIDLPITLAIQSFHPVWFDLLMKFLSVLGEPFWGSLILLLFVGGLFFYKQNKAAVFLFISTGGATLIATIFKIFVQRPRPEALTLDSFPSGHVLYFLGLYGFLFFLVFKNFKKTFLKNLLLFLLILLIGLIGISRIYLKAHWFSDVLGAYLIGTVWLYIVIYFYKKPIGH